MTTLGKIFVFVNLVFSLLVAGLIITVYVTRTNWKEGYELEHKQKLVAEQQKKNADADKELAIKQRDEDKLRFEENIKDLTDKLAQTEKERDDFRAKWREQETLAQKSDTSSTVSTAELQRRTDEVAFLQKQLDERDKDIVEARIEVQNFRNRAVKAEIEAKSLLDRNRILLDQVEDLAKLLEQAKLKGAVVSGTGNGTGNGIAGLAKNPPPENVRGLISQSDPDSGLVTITLGSDAGINEGNTLEVYRLKPKPIYLGTIRIIDVRHHQAVGRALSPSRNNPIQVGDEVASSILGQR
ncbi:MAG: hypothetical protein ACK4RK_18165 [Gemmataceae bacterium]